MKKAIICFCILFGVLFARASVVTNHVYIVSNIFHNVYTENVITQLIKNTHTDFFYTNYVSVVTNVYQTTFRTNVSVNVDVSQGYVNAAANAASNAVSFANQSAESATAAGSSASTARSAAAQAAASASAASSAAANGLQAINERINWFDEHSGETITIVNVNTNINITVNADDYNYPYRSTTGVEYENIRCWPYNANGSIAVSATSGCRPSLHYMVNPNYDALAANYDYWLFEPSYVDSDIDGMRLHYVPKEFKTISARYSSSEYFIPRDFYWQDGKIIVVIDSFHDVGDSHLFLGRIVKYYEGTGTLQYPNGLNHTFGNSTLTAFKSMTFMLQEGVVMGSNNASSICSIGIRTPYNDVGATDYQMWFYKTPPVEHSVVIDTIKSYRR